MSLETPIKYALLVRMHSHHYGDEPKGNETVYFEGVSRRNRFAIA